MSLRDIPIKLSYKSKGKNNILEAFLIPALKQEKCRRLETKSYS